MIIWLEKCNVVNVEIVELFVEVFCNFEIDDECVVVVLYGKGDMFCVGYDLEELF